MISSVVLAVVLAVGPSGGTDRREALKAAFDAGDYDTAATLAAEAYKAEGDLAYLYSQAQAERFGGRCTAAIEHYREFLEAVPDGAAAGAARDNIAECEQVLAKQPKEPEPTEPPSSTEPDEPPTDEPVTEPGDPSDTGSSIEPDTPWNRDVLAGVLVGTGVAATAVGVGIYGVAKADEQAAGEAPDVVTYGQRIDRAYTLSRAAIPVMAVGGALVVAGVIRWAVLAGRAKRSETPGSKAKPSTITVRPTGLEFRF